MRGGGVLEHICVVGNLLGMTFREQAHETLEPMAVVNLGAFVFLSVLS